MFDIFILMVKVIYAHILYISDYKNIAILIYTNLQENAFTFINI